MFCGPAGERCGIGAPDWIRSVAKEESHSAAGLLGSPERPEPGQAGSGRAPDRYSFARCLVVDSATIELHLRLPSAPFRYDASGGRTRWNG